MRGIGKAAKNESKCSHVVELVVASEGLDVKLSREIVQFHHSRRIQPQHVVIRRGLIYRWCFDDLSIAIRSVASFGERVAFFPDIARADDGRGITPGITDVIHHGRHLIVIHHPGEGRHFWRCRCRRGAPRVTKEINSLRSVPNLNSSQFIASKQASNKQTITGVNSSSRTCADTTHTTRRVDI